jgi:hypothetical protein
MSRPASRLTSEYRCGASCWDLGKIFDEPAACTHTRENDKEGSGGSKQSNEHGNKQNNNANQVQKITVDQDSGDVTLWIEGSGVSIGSINTGNLANVSANQSADQ